MAVLAIVDLIKNYGPVPAVRGISLTVNDGELVCILGPSGCGKSTTLRIVGGFEHADGGDVRLDGASISTLPPNRRPTAMVFQKYTLWPHMRVYDNVAFGLRLRHLDKATIERKVSETLELVGLPQARHRYPHQLSGGEQQRIALARALVLEPQVLLLDEPLGALDLKLRQEMQIELKRIQRAVSEVGITFVYVTHDQEEALSIADRIAVMHQGRLEQVDTPAAVYDHPYSLFVADFIGRMNLLEATYQRDRHALHVGAVVLPAPAGAAWPNERTLTVAIRPEDLRPTGEPGPTTFSGQVEVVMDLGHYRQISLQAPPLGLLTMVVGKEVSLASGETVSVAPVRYLVYPGRTGQEGEFAGASDADVPPPEEVRLEAAAPTRQPASLPSGTPD